MNTPSIFWDTIDNGDIFVHTTVLRTLLLFDKINVLCMKWSQQQRAAEHIWVISSHAQDDTGGCLSLNRSQEIMPN